MQQLLVNKNMPCYYVSVAFSSTKAVLRGKGEGNYVSIGWLLVLFVFVGYPHACTYTNRLQNKLTVERFLVPTQDVPNKNRDMFRYS
jgi:hypothetical protein